MYLVLTQEFIICISTYQLFFFFSWVLWSFPTAHLTIPSPSAPCSLHSLLYPLLCAPFKTMKPVLCWSHILGCVASHWSVADVTRSHRWYHLPIAQLGEEVEPSPRWYSMVLALAWASHTGRAPIVTIAEFKWAASLLASENTVSWSPSATFDFPPPLPPWSLGCGKRGHYTLDFKSTLIKSRKSSETELSTLIRLPFSFLLYNINLSTSFKPSSTVP